jgi:2-polyprenyl-3-methyl-5-hydroxy-6-metoxy-1,4-benzoquinol methylase
MWSRWYKEHWATLPPNRRSEGGQATSDDQFHRIAETIVRLARIQPWETVLDLGCSIGSIARHLAPHCHRIVGVDFIEDCLAYAREHNSVPNAEYAWGDLAEFDIPGEFDCIILNNVIHNLDSLAIAKRVLANSYQHLTPTGRLYLGEVPDRSKVSRYTNSTRRWLQYHVVNWMPQWVFPIWSKIRGRIMKRPLWYGKGELACFSGCSVERIEAYDDPDSLLNPIERTHFVLPR